MKSLLLALSLLLAAWLLPFSGGAAEAQEVLVADPAKASMTFAIAKLLADEGSFREALEAYEQAVYLAPKDPYIRAAYTELLARLAQLSRSPRYRQQQLQRAVEQAQAARSLAPKDADILQVAGQTFLTVAEVDPQNVGALETAREIFEQVRALSPGDVTARLTLGQILLYRGRPDEAIEVFKEAVDLSPANQRASGFLLEALKNAGRLEDVEAVYRDILAFDPLSEDALIGLAELLGERGEHQAAVDTLRGAPPELLSADRVRQMLAVQLFLSGDYKASLGIIDEAIVAGGDSPALGRLRALVLGAEGRNEEAAGQLRRLVAENPTDAELANSLARVLLRLGQGEESARVLGEAVARLEAADKASTAQSSAAGGLRLQWAELLLNLERWEQALEVLTPLRKAKVPQLRLGAELLAAEALVQLERGDEALELLSRSTSKDPAAQAKQAELLLRLERPKEADRLLTRLAASGEESSVLAAALVYQRFDRYAQVTELLEGFLKANPASERLLFMLASSLERQDRFDDSVREFQRLLEIDPENVDALNYLGYMWAERGENLDQALKMISKAVAQEPENGAFVDSLGWVYFQLGRYQEALEHLERAVQLVAAGDGTVLEHLGDAQRALGSLEEARKTYERALKAPDADRERLTDKLRQLKLRQLDGE